MNITQAVRERQQREANLGLSRPKLGFTDYAEKFNGRLAMLGFVIGLATEFLTGQGILSQLGLF
ncbi:chlorophyll a/b-binding protein [Synechococcus sp. PCC 7336]|uniref:chlorophyll a/b-binding protein n=1 Tax=Synechococcus sp. PCC 7336 TaxID=195250 RepID=UPI00034C7D6B|nr:chlorophyll a/b-binding protein [Synechococcus sp. PCC 7336]